jgi:phosphoserine phosphatase
VDDTYKIHKKYGLTKEIFDELIKTAEYVDGVKEFFKNLDREKYVTVFISGGFIELIRRAQLDLHIDHAHAACEYFFDPDDGYLVSRCLVPCDFEGKYDYVKKLFDLYNINPKTDWIFIGDGPNDRDIASRAPFSIAINAHEKLREVSKHIASDFFDVARILAELEQNEFSKPSPLKPINRGTYNPKLRKTTLDNQRTVQDEDYENTPKRVLGELLMEKKVVFVGLKEDYAQFRILINKYGDNLTIVPASDEQKDFKSFRDIDFLFIFTRCIGHKLAEKAKHELKVPYAHIGRFRNTEKLVTAMSNVLYREFYENQGQPL